MLLNGLKLDSQWDGHSAYGRDYLDFYGAKEAEWHISCLFASSPRDGSSSHDDHVIHVLSLRFVSSVDVFQPGFTVSYRQADRPAIIRFRPGFYPIDLNKTPTLATLWRIPSIEFDPDVLTSASEHGLSPSLGFVGYRQKSLGVSSMFKSIKGSIEKEFEKAIKHFCPKHNAKSSNEKTHSNTPIPTNELLGEGTTSHETTATSETHGSTTTIPNLSAAETRSLTTYEPLNVQSVSTSTPFSKSQSDQQIRLLKVFGLILVLSSLVAWVCLRCRDPRRRAECLARREERRNKNLYRRAAREHKLKMWFWSFRLKYGFASSEALSYDEKRARVIDQESILEDVMTEDIRALRNAHRIVSTITAAEEGRHGLVYGSEGSNRRRSVTTLPGYESEGSQPPNYEESGESFEAFTIADGFRFTSAETEFRSDSSVISTSPRISRDGTNSDFDEKFEPISLEAIEPAGQDSNSKSHEGVSGTTWSLGRAVGV